MKTIYFQLIGGAAGDMLLAALIDLGCPFLYLKKEFDKINIEFDVRLTEERIGHYTSKKIKFFGETKSYSYKEIIKLIKKSALKKDIKFKSLRVYEKLFDIEKEFHKLDKDDLNFHHLGQIDAIFEIVGFFISLEYLGIEKIYTSIFPVDFVKPATLKLLENKKIKPVNFGYETITPTAAALLLDAEQNDFIFDFKKASFAFGDFGSQDYLIAYLLEEDKIDKDKIVKIETNIDDMPPQIFENLFDELFKNGAKDVYIEQVIMKKSRPAFVLNVLCSLENFLKIRDIIFLNTSTFGIRYQVYEREKLKDRFIYKKTKFGNIKFRVSEKPFEKNLPEYNDCLEISKKLNIPLIDIYRKI